MPTSTGTPTAAGSPVPPTAPTAVLGGGIMGRGIARVLAAAGHDVRIREIDDDAADRGLATLEADLERVVARGHLAADERDAQLARITTTTSLEAAVDGVGLVVEAVPEVLELKREIFAALDLVAPIDALLATNTSALSVTAIAAATSRPERVVGLHFFNPVHRMALVEVVTGTATATSTTDLAAAWCAAMGKTTVTVADRPGFATSRINVTIGNEAFTMLMEGVASADDIDTAMKLALGHPMGPFELVDLVGLDTRLSVLRHLHAELGERFRPCPLLVNLVAAGRLGRKTGRGVFRYDDDGARVG